MAEDREAREAAREREEREAMEAAELVRQLAKFAGQYRQHPERFTAALNRLHRTEQQSVTGLMVSWLTYLANAVQFDGRNQASVALAKGMLRNDSGSRDNSPFFQNDKGEWVFIGLPYI